MHQSSNGNRRLSCRAIWEILAALRIPALCVHFLASVASVIERPQVQTTKPVCPTLIRVAPRASHLRAKIAEFLGVVPAYATGQTIINDDPAVMWIARWTHPACCPRPAAETARVRVLQTTLSANAPISEATVQWHVIFRIRLKLSSVRCIAE